MFDYLSKLELINFNILFPLLPYQNPKGKFGSAVYQILGNTPFSVVSSLPKPSIKKQDMEDCNA